MGLFSKSKGSKDAADKEHADKGGKDAPAMAEKSTKKRLGLLPPQAYMKNELDKLYEEFDVKILPAEESNWSPEHITSLVDFCKENDLPSVCGFAQKDAWHHALVNTGLGNVSIQPHAYLVAMNKYMQRTIEKKPFWFEAIDPESKSNDELWALIPENEIPFMLKNTSLSLGRGVFKIKKREDFDKYLNMYRGDENLRKQIKDTNDAITSRMTKEKKESLGAVPPFIAEHMVNLQLGWVEYCYEGCVDSKGNNTHYGITEEVYFEDHQSLAYVTPPVSYGHDFIPQLDEYLSGYMEGLVKTGYLQQFYNIEFWATFNTDNGQPEFSFCEINPRCAHTYHFGYMFAYGTNLYRDNWNLVLDDTPPTLTPWKEWVDGDNKYCTEILMTAVQEGKVGDILDFDFVDEIDPDNAKENSTGFKVDLIRHIKSRDYVLTADDAGSGAGCTMLQIWITTETPEEAAKIEVDMRKKIYKKDMGWEYPPIWKKLAGME